MFDNLSIKNLAGIVALISGLVVVLITLFISYAYKEVTFDFKLFAILLLFLVGIYFSVLVLLKKYLHARLTVLYKFIRKPSSALKAREIDFDNIDDVKSDVIKWASDTEKRIESLQTLAEYRKNFVGNVSHELKTPIFSLQGYLHTLLDGGIYDEAINVKYLERAAKNADRLQYIVEDLESIGRMESGKMDLTIESFDIRELIKEVFLDQQRSAEAHKITLKQGSQSEVPLLVKGDRESLRQVLNNLVTNSLKYGEQDGVTSINLYNIDKTILVEVADDGIGIEEKHLEHLFDRFYRVDTSRSRMQGGSGLGLSIVKHIIESHGQTINVQSTYGEGSKFGFTLEKG